MSNHVETSNHVNGENYYSMQPYSDERPKTYDTVLQLVGKTPIVKLNVVPPKDLNCEIFVKLEYMNPGGSVKDRIAVRMLEKAEMEKKVQRGKSTIIEPTSGNTGIGLAFACAVKGYKCIIVIPEKMSDEKVDTILALGAQVVKTPTDVASDDPKSNISVAHRMAREIENAVILDQYNNPENPEAHYEHTAVEILESMGGNVDMVVFGAGTGGTATGIARRIKEVAKNCITVGVDPLGSILAQPPSMNKTDITMYQVEGIGYDFVPHVLNREYIDEWVKTQDKDSFKTARELIQYEGIMCGGSAGAAVWAAIQAARRHPECKRIVVMLPDGIRNYMTKFLKDQWMEAQGYQKIPPAVDNNGFWWNKLVDDRAYRPIKSVHMDTATNKQAVELLRKHQLPAIAVMGYKGETLGALTLVGVFSADLVRRRLANLDKNFDDQFSFFVEKLKYYTVDLEDAQNPPTLGLVSRILDVAGYVIVTRHNRSTLVTMPVGVITSEDLLARITSLAFDSQ